MCKNVVASIIVTLGHSEVDTEVLDTGIKTVESDDCRGISENLSTHLPSQLVDRIR